MNDLITNYLTALIKKSKKELNKDYDFSEFNFTDFELINSFLIDRTLNDKTFSLLINNPEKKLKSDYYVPAILSAAISLFYQNYIDDSTVYQLGDIVQDKKGRRYEIVEKNDGKYVLSYPIPSGKGTKYENEERIKNYIITTADLTKRKVKIKFDAYRKFFDKIFKIGNYLPSKFIYKSVIIVEKKDFFRAVKKSNICELDFHRSLPFKYITKKGTESDNLPIEPMIYLVPDYESFKEFILPKNERIDTIVFIGANKYKSEALRNVKRDIRRGVIKNAIFIGKDDLEDFEGLKKWNWTLPELNFLNEITNYQLEKIEIEAPQFMESIDEFKSFIDFLEEEYTVELSSICKFNKYLFSSVLPDFDSRLRNQLEYVQHLFRKEVESLFKETFFSLNIDPDEKIKCAHELFEKILSALPLSKFEILKQQEKVDILLVPRLFQEIWYEEISKYKHLKNFRKTKVLNSKEFFEKENGYNTQKNIYLLTIFGYKTNPYELVSKLCQSSHKIHFLLYAPEIGIVEKLLLKYKTELTWEYQSADRLELTGIEYPKIEDDISDVIERFYQIEAKDRGNYEYDQTEQIYYQLDFERSFESLIFDGSKSVLIEPKQGKRRERVSNLIAGDKVRIYDNATKEQLFQIAVSEDKEGRFSEIDKYSKIWKSCLKKYFDLTALKNPLYQIENLMDEFQRNGSTLKNITTLRKWLNENDKERFPASIINLIALKKTIADEVLNENFEQIKKSRKLYRSIMIALGRDLSDEIMDYIISNSNNKGKILSKFTNDEIISFVNQSAPLKIIKQIQIMETSEDEQ
jgi:hypothetical protein